MINFSLLPIDNFTNPLFIYFLYPILFVIILLVIFEKPCLRKDNKGCMLMYVSVSAITLYLIDIFLFSPVKGLCY